MSHDPKPLPCPFCGTDPEIDNDPDACGGTVECMERSCAVRPSVYFDHEPHADGFHLAVQAWNQRAHER
jgi:hypothetical protein